MENLTLKLILSELYQLLRLIDENNNHVNNDIEISNRLTKLIETLE